MKKNQNKNIAIFAFSLLAMVGTYNAVMINSESHLSDVKNFKRLDEMFGVVTEGRAPAVTTGWAKVAKPLTSVASVKVESSVSEEASAQAAIQDSLSLKLVEVINPKKWEKGVKASDFGGSIATNNGIIESLSANLPENMNIEISFSEMTGNVFEYDLNGKVYSAMMYQVDQSSYMVTMTNGPLEGTRMRFAGEAVDNNSYLAETHNIEVGAFGEDMDAVQPEVESETSIQTAEAASFNFNQI